MTFAFSAIQHIGIPVTDLTKSEAFYQKLGFVNIMQSQFEYKHNRGNVSMLKRGEIIIELYQLPPAELAGIRNRKAGNIDHVAFDVDDIDAAFAELSGAKFTIEEKEPLFLPFWKNGCKYFNVIGPDGERLEFNQIL